MAPCLTQTTITFHHHLVAALALAATLAGCSKYDNPEVMQAELTRIRQVCAQEKTDQMRTACLQMHVYAIEADRQRAARQRMAAAAAGAAMQNHAAQQQALIAQQQAAAAARAPTTWNCQTYGNQTRCNGY